MQDLTDRMGSFLLVSAGNVLLVAIVVGVAWLAYRVLARVARTFVARAAAAPLPGEVELDAEQRAIRRAERSRRLETVVAAGLRLVRWFTITVIAIVVVSVFLPSVWAAIGGLGVGFGVAIGGAIGFGAQQLVRDYLNGMLILGENPYGVGDIVAIAGVRGTVEEVGLRRTVIRDADGTVHSVPNGEIQVAQRHPPRDLAAAAAGCAAPDPGRGFGRRGVRRGVHMRDAYHPVTTDVAVQRSPGGAAA
jgi:small-conductance mechanosensitive channel